MRVTEIVWTEADWSFAMRLVVDATNGGPGLAVVPPVITNYEKWMQRVCMRTTVVLKDHLVAKARELSKAKTLSGLLNSCLADWIGQHSRQEIEARLAEEYRHGRAESRRVSRDFSAIDKEGWPSW